jgi:SAM-dependent methyltransferase
MQDMHNEIKKYYEEWWENPRDPRNVIFTKLNKIVYERLPQGKGQKALDIGSGKGTIVSFLLQKGYKVTSVELNEKFVIDLKRKFPEVRVIQGDINSVSINDTFNVVTAIEFLQNLDIKALNKFFRKIVTLTDRLIINISNKNSLHGFWTAFRGFQKPFVHTYTPIEIERILEDNGFQITYEKGIGLLTPITLLNDFRVKLIPIFSTKIINSFGDKLLPRLCHLFYIEAKNKYKRREI